MLDDLAGTLTQAIEELTRPIDAIKHQAKTVTVGISRTDEMLLTADLVREVLDAGAPRDSLSYRTLRLLADLDAAVAKANAANPEAAAKLTNEQPMFDENQPKAVIPEGIFAAFSRENQ